MCAVGDLTLIEQIITSGCAPYLRRSSECRTGAAHPVQPQYQGMHCLTLKMLGSCKGSRLMLYSERKGTLKSNHDTLSIW